WHTDGATGALMHYYRAGATISPGTVRTLATLWLAATGLVTVLYVANLIRQLSSGRKPSWIKLSLLAISWLFYLYAFGMTSSKIVAFGLFEGYHDIQYLAIVWIFNRNRAAKDPTAGAFTRFLFRQRWPLVVAYIGLCLLFGSYDYVARAQANPRIMQTALAVITGFALIHFYFDGFIWRVREPEFQATLDVNDPQQVFKARIGPKLRHLLWWSAIAVPIAGLLLWERTGRSLSDLEACERVVAAMPHSHKAHYSLASVLTQQGDYARAAEHAGIACELRPGFDLYEVLRSDLNLGNGAPMSRSELDALIASYLRAERTRFDSAELQRNLGRAYQRRGDYREAIDRYRRALDMSDGDARTYFEYAGVLAQKGQFAASAIACENACRLDPNFAEAHALAGAASMAINRPRIAIEHFRRAIQLRPDELKWQVQMALAMATTTDPECRDVAQAQQIAHSVRPKLPADSALLRDLQMIENSSP
ncbi:MAG: tetratricopeptide repeat protein, partial [Planctomycetales bacterium]|nr:tetratricopeptide repeat protein [Planctomycetales bacterium]